MASKASVFKKLWGAAKSAYGVGMARDETVLRGLVSARGKAGAEVVKARKAMKEAAEGTRAYETALAKGDEMISAYNAEQSRIRKITMESPLFRDNPELAVDEARKVMAYRNAYEGQKVLAEVDELAKAGAKTAAEAEKILPGAKDAFVKAEADFRAAVERANERVALEKSVFGFKFNDQSHLWGTGKQVTPLWPRFENDTIEGAQVIRRMGRAITGKGFLPRVVTTAVRGAGRELSPVTMEGKMGRVLDVVTAPGVTGVAATGLTGALGGAWIAKKTGLYMDPAEDLVAKQAELRDAEKSKDPKRIETARAAVAKAEKRAGGGKPPVSVDQSNAQWTFDQIAADYRRTGDAAARDRAFALMGADAVGERLAGIRRRVFEIHNPGQSIDRLGASEAGKMFIREFDAGTFGTKTPQDWLTTDLDAYQRDLEARRYGEEN